MFPLCHCGFSSTDPCHSSCCPFFAHLERAYGNSWPGFEPGFWIQITRDVRWLIAQFVTSELKTWLFAFVIVAQKRFSEMDCCQVPCSSLLCPLSCILRCPSLVHDIGISSVQAFFLLLSLQPFWLRCDGCSQWFPSLSWNRTALYPDDHYSDYFTTGISDRGPVSRRRRDASEWSACQIAALHCGFVIALVFI